MTPERIKTLRSLELCLEGPDDLEINLQPRTAIKAISECLDEIERLREALQKARRQIISIESRLLLYDDPGESCRYIDEALGEVVPQ